VRCLLQVGQGFLMKGTMECWPGAWRQLVVPKFASSSMRAYALPGSSPPFSDPKSSVLALSDSFKDWTTFFAEMALK